MHSAPKVPARHNPKKPQIPAAASKRRQSQSAGEPRAQRATQTPAKDVRSGTRKSIVKVARGLHASPQLLARIVNENLSSTLAATPHPPAKQSDDVNRKAAAANVGKRQPQSAKKDVPKKGKTDVKAMRILHTSIEEERAIRKARYEDEFGGANSVRTVRGGLPGLGRRA